MGISRALLLYLMDELKDEKINSKVSGIPKLGLLWLELIISKCRNKRTYLIISQNSEYITALSLARIMIY
jgi:hypothetical protein